MIRQTFTFTIILSLIWIILISLELLLMEELQSVDKIKQFPQELKSKRKTFNNKRFHTMPSNSDNLQPKSTLRMQSLTQRSSTNAIAQAINKSLKSKRQKISKRRAIKQLDCFWALGESRQGLKTCRQGHQGYDKRRARVESNNQCIGLLFRDSTRLDNDKQNLYKNIWVISGALRNSFPKLELDNFRSDDSLRISREELGKIFRREAKSKFA